MIYIIVLWCNGSTTDFGSVRLGSNPGKTTFKTTYNKSACGGIGRRARLNLNNYCWVDILMVYHPFNNYKKNLSISSEKVKVENPLNGESLTGNADGNPVLNLEVSPLVNV